MTETVDTDEEARIMEIMSIKEGPLDVLVPRQKQQLKPFLRKALQDAKNEAYAESAQVIWDTAERIYEGEEEWSEGEIVRHLQDLAVEVASQREETEEIEEVPQGGR